jgi:hypothetical protein
MVISKPSTFDFIVAQHIIFAFCAIQHITQSKTISKVNNLKYLQFVNTSTMKSNMNFITAFFAFYLLFGPQTMMVTAERKIKYLFNSTTDSCTSADIEKVTAIFSSRTLPVLRERRQLLRSSTNVQQAQRELWPRKCANDCAGKAPGWCQVTDCYGYRRELQAPASSSTSSNTTASKFFTCGEETDDIDHKLQMLINNQEVTESCQKFLDPKYREVSCYDNVIYGVVENVRLWNMSASLTKPVLITDDLKDNFPICKSLVFNIEAKVNNCVDFVHFQMEGPNFSRDHTEGDVPYSLFGDSDTNVMFGKRLYYSGLYNLTIIPDGITSKTRTIQLNVLKC